MSRFEIDVPVVDALSAQVAAAGSDTRSALGAMNGAGCVDTGDAGLSGALSVFQQAWGSFTQAAAEAVEQTGTAIAVAAASYRSVDEHVIADPGVTSAFVDEVLRGGNGQHALDAAAEVPPHGAHGRGPR